MARTWCGFMPQNQNIKEQWVLLEARRDDVGDKLRLLLHESSLQELPDTDPEEFIQIRVKDK